MTTASPSNRCQHTDAAGRRCKTPRAHGHPTLCPHHATPRSRRHAPQHSSRRSRLAARVPRDFYTQTSINQFLRNVVLEFVNGRADARTAAVLGYLCQLMLQTTAGVHQERILKQLEEQQEEEEQEQEQEEERQDEVEREEEEQDEQDDDQAPQAEPPEQEERPQPAAARATPPNPLKPEGLGEAAALDSLKQILRNARAARPKPLPGAQNARTHHTAI